MTFDLGQPTQGVKIVSDETRGLAIVLSAGIAVAHNLKAGKPLKTIKGGKTPHNAELFPNGTTAYVTLQGGGAIATIDREPRKKAARYRSPAWLNRIILIYRPTESVFEYATSSGTWR